MVNTPPQNYPTAFKYYKMSAEQGHSGSQYQLGQLYEFGMGVPENVEKSNRFGINMQRSKEMFGHLFLSDGCMQQDKE